MSAPAPVKRVNMLIEALSRAVAEINSDSPACVHGGTVLAAVEASAPTPVAPPVKVGQCGEVCDRARLCAACSAELPSPAPLAMPTGGLMNDAFLAWWETADDFGGSVEAACRAAFKVGAAWRQLRIPVLEAERDSWQKQASRWLDDSLRFAGERDTMRIAVDRLTGELAALSQADGKVERGIERLRARVRELELCITGLEKEGERVARELDAECDALRTAAGCSEALRERLSLAETALERERHARKLAQTEREKASEERNRAGVDARCEVGELIAQLKADRADAINQHAAALDLVSRIRWALGDNGARMQDELIEWCKHLSTGAATERELVINRKESEL